MKVYSSWLGYEVDLTECKNENGTVDYNGKKLCLTQPAYVNCNGDYKAQAIDANANIYNVTWVTTAEWKLAEEQGELAGELSDWGELDLEDDRRLAELAEMNLPSTDDEGDACDWGHPVSVELINREDD